jgi:hypothetical protein
MYIKRKTYFAQHFFDFVKGIAIMKFCQLPCRTMILTHMWEGVCMYYPQFFSHGQQISNPQPTSLPSRM